MADLNNRAEVLAMFKRIKNGPEGQDFMEYLSILEKENFEAFLADDQEMNDIHKGYGLAIDNFLVLLRECEQETTKKETKDFV